MSKISLDDLKRGDEIIVTIKTKVGGDCICTGLDNGLDLDHLRAAVRGGANVKVEVNKKVKVDL